MGMRGKLPARDKKMSGLFPLRCMVGKTRSGDPRGIYGKGFAGPAPQGNGGTDYPKGKPPEAMAAPAES